MSSGNEILRLLKVVEELRGENGCPWDKSMTHESLKAHVIEEAAEVICGINEYVKTGNPDNLKEELGDLLFIILLQTRIAKEEGLFDFDDVCGTISEKMIMRHPHVFKKPVFDENGRELKTWDELKAYEKKHMKKPDTEELFEAFNESKELIDVARNRKLKKLNRE
ncbi:MAG: nucleotide pyrophosphohydrolase [Lachnospiraceae bacterium]|nr:nucleotide pyrophosphohydrolase [Lachnospiraceae bacterium]